MKQFIKFMFASMLGVFLSLFLLVIVFGLIIAAAISASSTESSATVKENTLLTASFSQGVPDRTPPSPFPFPGMPDMGISEVTGLNDILANIKKAEADENIKGIYLDLSYVPVGLATLEDIRDALVAFRKSDKFIIAYGENLSQSAYYLASAADKVYLHPEGNLEFSGMASKLTFFSGTLEKLGINPQIIRVGTYKSAVEPFTEVSMSPANREQVKLLLDNVYGHYLQSIGESRQLSPDSLFHIADSLLIRQPEDALRYGLIDSIKYEDEVLAELKQLTGIEEDNELHRIQMNDYTNSIVKKENGEGRHEKIAVIYASGEIVSGEGTNYTVGSESVSKAIREARNDEDIKAIVLRVNSPGGSALASDVIWREMTLAKKEKPVVVSMGDVAASGGYYIACPADKIIAQPNTITGSIGVFAIIPNMQEFFNEHLGITFDGVKTSRYADLGGIDRPLTEEEKAILQDYVNNVYEDFTGHVAEGRNMSITEVDSIGQGRVWSGVKALETGLVDTLGGFRDALRIAAEMAKIEKFRTVEYPSLKSPLDTFFGNVQTNIRTWLLKEELGEDYRYYERIKQIRHLYGVQALLPFGIEIH